MYAKIQLFYLGETRSRVFNNIDSFFPKTIQDTQSLYYIILYCIR